VSFLGFGELFANIKLAGFFWFSQDKLCWEKTFRELLVLRKKATGEMNWHSGEMNAAGA